MTNSLIRRSEQFVRLSDGDKRALELAVTRSRIVEAGKDILFEGEPADGAHLVLQGFACRYKLSSNGGRQIFAFVLAGDLCGFHECLVHSLDYGVSTLSRCTVVDIPQAQLLELLERPAVARAFRWANFVNETTLREWVVNLGTRNAEARIAHLFCELHARLRSLGLAHGDQIEWPVTQLALGETVGLTAVHVNRTLQALRARNLITLQKSVLTLLDVPGLRRLSGFDAGYLHLHDGWQDASRPDCAWLPIASPLDPASPSAARRRDPDLDRRIAERF